MARSSIRLGHGPLKAERRVRFPYALPLIINEFEQEFFKTVRPSSLLKRFATTEEVANLVTYVCSPLSAATNGAALRVDGGVVQACF